MEGKENTDIHNHVHDMEYLKHHLSRTEDFQVISEVFRQLGDATRVRIFWLLCHCEECVSNIADMMNMSSPAISHHLRVLKNCGLIVSNRCGKEVYYKASDSKQSQLMHLMIEQVMEISCPK